LEKIQKVLGRFQRRLDCVQTCLETLQRVLDFHQQALDSFQNSWFWLKTVEKRGFCFFTAEGLNLGADETRAVMTGFYGLKIIITI